MTDTVIVRDTGFGPDDWTEGFAGADTRDLASDANVDEIADLAGLRMIRVDFPSFADGRGFTIARLLRLKGYTGRLRARGHVLADQYAMARRSGFDEVEISADLAARQPEDQWQFRADWQGHDYQSRLRAGA
ncbi:DUF934 domain-containing protein [Marinovum sp.]|uniref:DUF934 domain-containing protein n=1 Tax=Marinovum sp. TaxID=2024839 RepID=UPI002B275285|nr:DUF934 domain-containing protein [Marinovum sp.]